MLSHPPSPLIRCGPGPTAYLLAMVAKVSHWTHSESRSGAGIIQCRPFGRGFKGSEGEGCLSWSWAAA
eukprot:1628642-Rhodomonas_salina.1